MTSTSIISWELRPYKFKNEETNHETKTRDIEYLFHTMNSNEISPNELKIDF